jgi:hypothetical protein
MLAILFFFLFGYYWVMVDTGLPSDEEMIARFQKDYPDLEKLVHSYRYYEASPDAPHIHYGWRDQKNVKDLMEKIGVEDITHLLAFWLPNPYSVETAKMTDEKFRSELKDRRVSMFYRYSSLQVTFLPRLEYFKASKAYILVWKRLMYFPEPPRIEDGYLLGPVDEKGNYSFKKRVRSSLNRFPFYFKPYECVYRKLSPHWFLNLCNGH